MIFKSVIKTYFLMMALCLIGCESSTSATGNKERVFIFDKEIRPENVELELYDLLSKAKKIIYLKNFPSLNIRHSKNEPDFFIDLLSKKKEEGIDIRVIHQAKKGLYPLTKHLYMNNIKKVKQLNDSYDYGVVGEGAKYAIIDEIVFVIHDPDDYPRIIGLEVEKKDIKEDFQYTWEYILKNEKRLNY